MMSHKMSNSMRWFGICFLYGDWQFELPKEAGYYGPVVSAVDNPLEGSAWRHRRVWRHREEKAFDDKTRR